MKRVIVITGPTASGKTAVAVELAGKINGEIINCDSMQVYKGCNIGSAKPTIEEMKGIPHHLIDIAEPAESFSAADYKELALGKINHILSEGKVPVLTGGTGLYIDTLVRNIDFTGSRDDSEARRKLDMLLEEKGSGYLHGLLMKRDPEAAGTVHPNNTRRVIRYLEILDGYEGSLKEYMQSAVSKPAEYDFRIFVLWPDRKFVYKRIEDRIDGMLEAGLLDEVRGLYESGVHEDAQAMMGIGYKETLAYIKGEVGYGEFIELLKRNTRRYAKRQFTWFRRYDGAAFIPVDADSTVESILNTIYGQI